MIKRNIHILTVPAVSLYSKKINIINNTLASIMIPDNVSPIEKYSFRRTALNFSIAGVNLDSYNSSNEGILCFVGWVEECRLFSIFLNLLNNLHKKSDTHKSMLSKLNKDDYILVFKPTYHPAVKFVPNPLLFSNEYNLL